ncbi:MAG TPA: M1 family aminopeptidase/hydrolase [Thermoanaerobaculia bacterium]|nr:M1 family aminopeptidase/hydrolase [Thermoanaerobaculia bacterium]
MPRRRLALGITVFLLCTALDAAALRQRSVRHPSFSELDVAPADVFSFSEPSKIRVSHVSLDLTVDFDARRLHGSATLDLNNFSGTRTLVLDTNDLAIAKITLDGAIPATWSYGASTVDGDALRIDITPSTRRVTIEYATSPDASGLYWNTAMQSYGRRRPYLYSLNEPNDARSWIPTQDTPTVRMTYDATLRVPPDLVALMSAENNPQSVSASGLYTFRMPRAIPAYLIALAVGRLEFRAFDARTGVYAEPELIEDAAWELQYLPEMLAVAEGIAGPLPFVRHDVLMMPPTFVVGGMEHPMLNFISPFSVLTGNHPAQPDPRNLIAHELAHSWAGDSTTLASWEDIWLNEGITSYLALRILEVMQGRERSELAFFLDRRDYAGYAQQVQDKSATILHRPVPHAAFGFNFTGYTKGELFLRTLEDRIGRASFDAFLRAYFAAFSYRWIDHRNFLAFLRASVPVDESALRLEEWIYGTGLPSNVTAPASSTFYARVQQRANAFNAGTPVAQLNPQNWSEPEADLFLQLIALSSSRMAELDAAFGLSLRVTPPLVWLGAAATHNYTPGLPAVERALLRGGPNSWILNLYRALSTTSSGRTRALDIFQRSRDRYADYVEAQVESILNPGNSNAARSEALESGDFAPTRAAARSRHPDLLTSVR